MNEQHAAYDDQPFLAFVPSFRRIFIAEFMGLAVAVGTFAVIMYFFKGLEYSLLTTIATGVLGVLWVALSRRSRRVTIGDAWISGPTGKSSGSTTVFFDRVDWQRSGFRRGHFLLQTASGAGIAVKTSWYDPEDIAEIKRLVRDRCQTVELPSEFY